MPKKPLGIELQDHMAIIEHAKHRSFSFEVRQRSMRSSLLQEFRDADVGFGRKNDECGGCHGLFWNGCGTTPASFLFGAQSDCGKKASGPY